MKWLLTLGIIVIALYAIVVALLYFFQTKMIFPGEKLPPDFNYRPLPGVSERRIQVEGATLSALHFQNEDPRGLIFFLHGNAGNLDSWVPDVDFYASEKFDLFMIDYRGYGKSNGRIGSQSELENDVMLAWQSVIDGYYDKQLPIVVYGRSLGTYLATQLASKVNPELLVLVSPYTSIKAMAKRAFPWIPGAVLRFPMQTDQIIDTINSPIIILHGQDDQLIPVEHAKQLQQIAKTHGKVVSLEIIADAAHNDIHEFAEYNRALSKALPTSAQR